VGVDVDRAGLLARYRELVLVELPRAARAGRWVVTEDHCFGRIVLDHAVGGRWYDVLDRRRSPAFAQLDDARLAGAVRLAERMLAEGDPLVRELDEQSLRWRGKTPKSLGGAQRLSSPATVDCSTAARAASSRATGTRNGEHDT
jgi:hypothetical protein